MRTVPLGLTDLNTWVLFGGIVWRDFLAGRKYVTVGGSGLRAALPPTLVWLPCFVFPVGGVVSLLPLQLSVTMPPLLLGIPTPEP